MTGRRSHGRLSALNGVVHQGSSLTETRVRDWQYWPERFDGSADRTMNPCWLDGTDQLARTVLAACVEPDGPVDADGDQARVIDDARHPAFLSGGWRGGTAVGRGHRGAHATAATPPVRGVS